VSDGLASFCERCGAVAAFSAQVPPLGNTLGKRVFYCRLCDHYTWNDWTGSLANWAGAVSRPKSTATIAQQQQQQQPKPDKATDGD
jgi:hypothetical protein